MKMRVIAGLVLLAAAGATQAQDSVPNAAANVRNVAVEFSAAPVTSSSSAFAGANAALVASNSWTSSGAAAPANGGAVPDVSLSADPAPAAPPKFVYGGRDDFRWQLGIGISWLRFRSSVFNASAVGTTSSVTYFTNEWFGVEGVAITGFSSDILPNARAKFVVYGAGPKIALRERKWEPWIHAIVGGSHEQPQTAAGGRNSFAVMAGGGADYRFNPRFSGRLEGNWVRTGFFSQNQNNFQLGLGVVFHF